MRPLLAIAILITAALAFPTVGNARNTSDVVGVVHWGGHYNFTNQDYLNEGADRISQLGSHVIKVALSSNPSSDYPYNSPAWPSAGATLVQVAQTPYFQALFQKNFSTYILVAATSCGEFSDGFTDPEYSCENAQLHDLARYLILTYQNTGKTFVLQNWEGDNKLNNTYNDAAFTGMKRYLTSRQSGVNQARTELSSLSGVTVLNAAEVNLVWEAALGYPRATNMVLPALRYSPYLPPDLYSYSVWDFDTQTLNPSQLLSNLDYLQSQTGASRDQIYLGEYGVTNHIDDVTDRDQIAKLTQSALTWGVRYLTYWEIFSNESGTPTTWWLVRPDNTLTPAWYYFQDLMQSSLYRVTLRNLSYSTYLSANAQSGSVTAASTTADSAATFLLLDLNGGNFSRGDRASLISSNGTYVTAESGGGGALAVTRWLRGPWEEFTIQDDFPSDGTITNGDTVVFTSGDGHDARARSVSDAAFPGAVRADGTRPAPDYIPYDVLWTLTIQ